MLMKKLRDETDGDVATICKDETWGGIKEEKLGDFFLSFL